MANDDGFVKHLLSHLTGFRVFTIETDNPQKVSPDSWICLLDQYVSLCTNKTKYWLSFLTMAIDKKQDYHIITWAFLRT